MSKKIIVAIGVLAISFLLSSSNVWAELCLADANCDGKVTGTDLGILKQEYGTFNCDPVCVDIDTDTYDSCDPENPCDTDDKLADCDDWAPAINPDMPEVCDDWKDNDCDGYTDCADTGDCLIDNDTDTYYAKPCGNDCNDWAPAINPDMPEVCDDEIDNDCDGLTDWDDPDCPRAPVPKTGQTTSYTYGDDGYFQKGLAWPIPRFTDNGDGTVTDNLTGLIWLKDANCVGKRNWSQAMVYAYYIEDGVCGLTDGSIIGDWRLPNVREIESLIHYGFALPALPNTEGTGQWMEGDPFINVLSSHEYWSSTTYVPFGGDHSYTARLYLGYMYLEDTSDLFGVWPVRGPE